MERFKKYIDLALVLAALVVWYLLRHLLLQVWDIFRLPMMENWPLSLPAIISLVVAIGAFVYVRRSPKAFGFLGEVATELSKVTWPTMQETVASTGVIVVMIAISSMTMFLFDAIWGTFTQRLLTLFT